MKNKMSKTIGYARVSTREQSENTHALEQQIDRLKTAGAEYILQDIESGANPERPQFNQLIELVKERKIDTIIATRWDRLTREENTYANLKFLLQTYEVNLKLLDQGEVDLSTACGELSADMQAIFAVHERRMLRERVCRGFEYKRKRLSAWGRQPWGYTINNDKYALDTRPLVCVIAERPDNYQQLSQLPDNSPDLIGISKADIAREAIEYFLQVQKARDVLRYLFEKYGVVLKKDTTLVLTPELMFWRQSQSFTEWIQNPVLRGHTAYNKCEKGSAKKRGNQKPAAEWELHENTHPDQCLLTEAELREAKAIIDSNTRTMGTSKTRSQLSGLVICAECLSKCVNKNNQKYRYYGCRNYSVGCSNKTNIRVDRIESQLFCSIIAQINQDLDPTNSVNQLKSNRQEEIDNLEHQLEVINTMLQQHRTQALETAKIELEKELKKRQNSVDLEDFQFSTAQELIEYPYLTHLGFWYSLNIQERELLYSKLIKAIYVQNGEIVKMMFNF